MMPEVELSFPGPHGVSLAGVLCRPEDATDPSPAPGIVLCQGLSGVKHLVLPEIAARLAAQGFASIRFDYSGYGESTGEPGWIDPDLLRAVGRMGGPTYARTTDRFNLERPKVGQ